ncbi:MAG: hypothetical protein ACKN9T_10705 [Candidatus Methylumidiphilus sp.]
MITNPLLEEKYRVQRELSEEAEFDMVEYAKITQRIVAEVEAQYGFKFKYAAPQHGFDEHSDGRSASAVN